MKETKKADIRRINCPIFDRIFRGNGIDIGYGNDPLDKSRWKNINNLDLFDLIQGDANYINKFCEEGKYDFVYSSHCLEHMEDPYSALVGWWKLVKKGGYLILIVPDEDLYEQGVFPSRFNSDHKFSFTIYKKESWNTKSINIIDILKEIDCKIIKIELIDSNYDYTARNKDQSRGDAETSIEVIIFKEK